MSKLKAVAPKQTKPPRPKIVLFGKPKVGKTFFALAFPNVYFIDTEGGARLNRYQERLKEAGGAYLGPEEGSISFDTIIDQVKALATEKHGFKTLVIDSISKAMMNDIADEADKLKSEGTKNEWGLDRKPAIAQMRQLVRWIMRLDMNVLMIAHQKDEYAVINKKREVIGETFDAWDRLEHELDLILQAKEGGGKRLMSVRASRLEEAGQFPKGDTFPLSFEEFSKRFGDDIIQAESKVLEVATTEQVNEVGMLLQKVRVDPDWEEKVFKKAQVDSWTEMDRDKIQAVIDSLKQKMAV